MQTRRWQHAVPMYGDSRGPENSRDHFAAAIELGIKKPPGCPGGEFFKWKGNYGE